MLFHKLVRARTQLVNKAKRQGLGNKEIKHHPQTEKRKTESSRVSSEFLDHYLLWFLYSLALADLLLSSLLFQLLVVVLKNPSAVHFN